MNLIHKLQENGVIDVENNGQLHRHADRKYTVKLSLNYSCQLLLSGEILSSGLAIEEEPSDFLPLFLWVCVETTTDTDLEMPATCLQLLWMSVFQMGLRLNF